MRARGVGGEVRAGYQTAVRLGAWTIDFEPVLPRRFALTAEVLERHAYWTTQPPHDLVLRLGTIAWRWPAARFAVEGTTLTADLAGRPLVDEQPAVAAKVG